VNPLCDCPSGFTCTKLCDDGRTPCGLLPPGRRGSFCVRDAWATFDPDRDGAAKCGGERKPPQ
jgi:hypothetical protein